MRSRDLVRVAAAITSLAACSPRTDGPAPASADPPVAAAPSSSSAIAAAPSAAPATIASAAASAPPPELPPPPSAETLAKLPTGAAMYFAARTGDVSLAALPLPRALERDLGRSFGGKSPEVFLASIGVDGRRPILGAVVPASEKSARAVVDALAAGASSAAQDKLLHDHAGDVTHLRLLVPLTPGTDAARAAAALAQLLAGSASSEACPGAAACASFGAGAPLLVAVGERAVAAYADGPDLRLDLALPLFASAAEPAVLAALVAFRHARGGFEGRCSRFDAGATASLCVDAAPTGDLGATTGYGMTVKALSSGGVDATMKRKLAAAGRAESQRNLELAAPARRLASDGTVVIDARRKPISGLVTWALPGTSRPAVEKAFSTERCAAGHAVTAELLPALRAAFGDPGKGFTDPKKVHESFLEAGWPAFPIALSGTWPNLLDMLTGPLGRVAEVPAAFQICARHDAGRLTLTVKQAP